MSRFKRNEAFFQQSESGNISGGGGALGIKNAFKHARKTGHINLSSKLGDLREIPAQTFEEEIEAPAASEISYSFDARPDDDAKFWEVQVISTVDLSFNKLSTLPSTIANLGDLTTINLRDNEVVELPIELFTYCVKLRVVDLSQNCLGSLPPAVSNLIDLRELYVSYNKLTEIPDSLCYCRGLNIFEAHSNRLRSLPSGIMNLSMLSKLIVHSNQLSSVLSDCDSLETMTSLSLLDIHKNRISTLPDLTNMGKLSVLDARENEISTLPLLPTKGTVVQMLVGYNRISKLTNNESFYQRIASSYINLTEIHINNNNLISIPSEFVAVIRNVKVLEVSNNDISDVPYELGYVESLTKLALEGNPIRSIRRNLLTQSTEELKKFLRTRGEAPHWSSEGETLAAANISSTSSAATGNAMAHAEDRVRNMQGDCLDLSMLNLETLPEWLIAKLFRSFSYDSDDLSCRVQEIILANNKLTQIPRELGAVQSLRVLDLSGNNLSRLEVEGIDYSSLLLPKIQSLNVSNNGLSSPALEAILYAVTQSNCPLSCLLASKNSIDRFPDIIMHISTLREVDLSNNVLQNVLILNECPRNSLEILNLSNNQIRHVKGIEILKKLSSLSLDNNNIMDVPLEIGLITTLKSLTLNGNPQKLVRSQVLQKGNEAVISYLRNKVPEEWKERSSDDLYAGKVEKTPDATNRGAGNDSSESAFLQEEENSREVHALLQEIERLDRQLASPSLSSAMQFKLKKEIAMKRSQLIRLNRAAKK